MPNVKLSEVREQLLNDRVFLDNLKLVSGSTEPAKLLVMEADYAVKQLLRMKDAYSLTFSVESIKQAIKDVAGLGLTCSPQAGQVYLTESPNVKVEISYRGIEQLYYKRAGLVQLQVDLVREGEVFEVTNSSNGPGFLHKPVFAIGPEKPVVAAYCFAKFASGATFLEIMTSLDLEDIKAAAIKKANGKIPATYAMWGGEMYKKSVVRRASKHWPQMMLTDKGYISEVVEQFSTPIELGSDVAPDALPPPAQEPEAGPRPDYECMTTADMLVVFAPLAKRMTEMGEENQAIAETIQKWSEKYASMYKVEDWFLVPRADIETLTARVAKRVSQVFGDVTGPTE